MNMGISRLTTLAFSMYTNKGAYALLLGAGISRSAQIPSGWEVENLLLKQLAASHRVTDRKDLHEWYKETYKKPATYSSLLGDLTSSPTERVHLMKGFFEATDEENDLGLKKPTKAHQAIAKLVKNGSIRVILTTNFDRLLERALEAEGITPQVICHESDIEKSTPIVHAKTATIIKINGDYIDCRFRNTAEELDDYPDAMKKYVSRIFEDYGLITCGWSAIWDKGLIDIINQSSPSRYNSFFTNVGETSDDIKKLAESRGGEVMPIKGADELFHELYEQITALDEHNVNRNMNRDMMMIRIKKYLSSDLHNIEYSDLIEKLGNEAYHNIIAKANYNFQLSPEQFKTYLELHHNAVELLIDAAILAARWGKDYHIKAFGDVLVKLCLKPTKLRESYYEKTQYLHALGAFLLLNAIGIACIKYERYTELNKILKLSVPAGNFIGFHRMSLLSLLGYPRWDPDLIRELAGSTHIYPWSFILLENLRTHFISYFTVDSEYDNTFYIWEHLESLLVGYNKCDTFLPFFVPIGQFYRSGIRYKANKIEEEPYSVFFANAEKLKDEWEPIRQGMFGGSFDEYKNIYDQAEAFYQRNAKW